MGIDVIHFRGFDSGALQGHSHAPGCAFPIRSGGGDMVGIPRVAIPDQFSINPRLSFQREFEFFQKDKAFEEVTSGLVNDGYIIVRTTTAGAKFFAYAVVTDNITGDPTYVTAIVPE